MKVNEVVISYILIMRVHCGPELTILLILNLKNSPHLGFWMLYFSFHSMQPYKYLKTFPEPNILG